MVDMKERIGERIDAHVRTLNLGGRAVDLFTHRDTVGDLWDRIELGKSGWCDACMKRRVGPGWRRDLTELAPELPPEAPMPHIYLCELHTAGLDTLGEEAEPESEEEDEYPVLSLKVI